MIYFGGNISGASYNPAVSMVLFLQNKLSLSEVQGYVGMELLGAYVALELHKHLK